MIIQTIEAEESDYLYTDVSQIANAGMGLYTAIKIFKDEQIAVFDGEILSHQETKKRAEHNEDQYFISLLNGKTLDSKNKNCFAKFANDAKGSETAFKNNSKITLNDQDQVCLVASKTIQPSEEIFTGYGLTYWKKHGSM